MYTKTLVYKIQIKYGRSFHIFLIDFMCMHATITSILFTASSRSFSINSNRTNAPDYKRPVSTSHLKRDRRQRFVFRCRLHFELLSSIENLGYTGCIVYSRFIFTAREIGIFRFGQIINGEGYMANCQSFILGFTAVLKRTYSSKSKYFLRIKF